MKKIKLMKIPNEIFTYRLKPASFVVYIYLSSNFYWMPSVQIKMDTIAARCHMSVNTVQTAINQLVQCGLLNKIECFKNRLRTYNEYKIKKLPGGFSLIEKKIVNLQLDNYAFMILCYIRNRANHAGKSFPSLTQIQRGTGISRNAVIAKIKLLHDFGLLCKERYERCGGRHGQNNHTLFTLTVRVALFSILSRLAAYGEWLHVFLTAFLSKAEGHIQYPVLFRLIYSLFIKLLLLFSFIREQLHNCRRIPNTS